MISKLHITPIYWLCAFGGLIAFLWIAPAINQLRFSYYPNGLQGGLIKVDRLTGRMELCLFRAQSTSSAGVFCR